MIKWKKNSNHNRIVLSLKMDDFDIILQALDSADFYCSDAQFFSHLEKFKTRLQNLHDKSEKKFNEMEKVKDEFIVSLFKGKKEEKNENQ